MSWNNPPSSYQQQYPPQQPYQQYPPQNQSSQPPSMQYNQNYPPPQGGYPPPQQQNGYAQSSAPPPNSQYGQQQYDNRGYGAPPPQQYGAPPTGYPPQGQQQGYPPQAHGYPPQSQGYPAPQGPPGGYGVPPQNYNAPASYGPPTPPSPGYDGVNPQIDTSRDADALRSSMKGFGTKETPLIQTLVRIPSAPVMLSVRQTFHARHKRDLLADIHSETSGYFRETLEALARGPLAQDIHVLHDAIKGPGTNETALNDVLLARSNADISALKLAYQRAHNRDLAADVKGELSMKTERLFAMVLAARRAEDSAPVDPHRLDADVRDMHAAMEGRVGTDSLAVCAVFSERSDGQLRALSQEFARRFQIPLARVVEKEFSGHMREALLRMLACAEDRAMADAVGLEEAMKGAGTKDRLLLNRLVRIHWLQGHMGQVKGAYRHRFKTELAARVRGETSGHYRDALIALVDA